MSCEWMFEGFYYYPNEDGFLPHLEIEEDKFEEIWDKLGVEFKSKFLTMQPVTPYYIVLAGNGSRCSSRARSEETTPSSWPTQSRQVPCYFQSFSFRPRLTITPDREWVLSWLATIALVRHAQRPIAARPIARSSPEPHFFKIYVIPRQFDLFIRDDAWTPPPPGAASQEFGIFTSKSNP